MLRWLSNILASTRATRTALRAFRLVRARYDAAVTSDENRRHWAHADGLSANAAANPVVRRTLRNRARYEVANNSYARGIVLTLANDVVGTGPRLQLLTGDNAANTRVEHEFSRWARSIGLAEKLRSMRIALAEDGEAFAILISNPALPTTIKLDLRLIEADQVCTPDLPLARANAVDGIVFDEAGNPTEYHVLKRHPGDAAGSLPYGLDYDRVPAEAVIHWFRADRPGQSRGVPDLTPALPLFAQLRRYTLAVITAAETAALPGGVLYTDSPPGGDSDSVEPMDTIELERGTLMTMPSGWKMGQIKAEQPTTAYGEFKREILNEIARCLSMPFNIAACNSSAYNYASGRLDHQVYHRALRVEQSHLECVVLDRILSAWLDEAVLIPGLLPTGLGPIADWPHQWFWDGREHVDPAKEANAQATRLASHTTTLANEYAKQGRDWEAELRQRAREIALMRELGFDVAQDSSAEEPDPEEEDEHAGNQAED